MKIVINKCYGGFGLSQKAIDWFKTKGAEDTDSFYEDRSNPLLVECVEVLGPDSHTDYSKLRVVEIPDDVEWEIKDYDGDEWISEKHRTWS